MKSSLRSQLSEEIAKPIYNSTTFIDARNNIETLVSMVEMAYGLPYQHEDSTVAINLVDAQLDRDLSQSPFDRDQDRFEMIRILNEERVEYSKGKSPDLEQLWNKIGSIFKPIEEEAPEDETLHAALTAQIRKSEYQGTQAKNRTGRMEGLRNKLRRRAVARLILFSQTNPVYLIPTTNPNSKHIQ